MEVQENCNFIYMEYVQSVWRERDQSAKMNLLVNELNWKFNNTITEETVENCKEIVEQNAKSFDCSELHAKIGRELLFGDPSEPPMARIHRINDGLKQVIIDSMGTISTQAVQKCQSEVRN